MYNALGAGWTFVLLSGICVAGMPLSFIVIRYGKSWRDKREERAETKARGISINLGDVDTSNGDSKGAQVAPPSAEKVQAESRR